jgi:hypothetical protein
MDGGDLIGSITCGSIDQSMRAENMTGILQKHDKPSQPTKPPRRPTLC